VKTVMTEQDLLAFADERLADWNRRAGLWYALYYLFGGLAVLLTITVASRPHFIPRDPDWYPTVAWLAALFQGLSTFLVALPKAAAYRAAWRILWLARTEFIDDEKSEESAKLLKQAISKGWSLIDSGYTEAFKVISRRFSTPRRTTPIG
jgi:hypothetical protein